MTHLRGSQEAIAEFLAPIGTVASASDIDGLRMTLTDGKIVHLRPSGNAPEMRCYVEAGTEAEAKALLTFGLTRIKDWAKASVALTP